MPTYYEILNVPTTASAAEIQTAYEHQYNQWRRLVTHHDPNVVNQANQALQALETIRATLTDPSKRSAYDAGIGLSRVGELADPTVILRRIPPTPPPPERTSQTPGKSQQRVDAWVCPKCDFASPIGSRFCRQCGHVLGTDCPSCGKLIPTNDKFCASCGADVIELRDKERRRFEEEKEKDRRKVEEEKHKVIDWLASIERQNAKGSAGYAAVKSFVVCSSYDQVVKCLISILNSLRCFSRNFEVVSEDPRQGHIVAEGRGIFVWGTTMLETYLRQGTTSDNVILVLRCYPWKSTSNSRDLEESILTETAKRIGSVLKIQSLDLK